MEAPDWPDTKEPLCYVCTRKQQARDDSRTLADALDADDPNGMVVLVPLIRLVLDLAMRVRTLEQEKAK